MKQALGYSIKVWLTTAVVAPVLITGLQFLSMRHFIPLIHVNPQQTHQLYHDFWIKHLRMIIGSVVLMIPLGFAVYYSIKLMAKREVRSRRYKLYLSVIGVFFSVLPYTLLLGYMMTYVEGTPYAGMYLREIFVTDIIYGLVALSAIWLYKLKPVEVVSVAG